MFLLQESTPDTSAYLIAGYTVAFTIMAIYVASLIIRRRNLQRDQRALEDLQSEKKIAQPASQPRRIPPPTKKTGARRTAKPAPSARGRRPARKKK